jgi:Sec-independent protein translocase protein TatA
MDFSHLGLLVLLFFLALIVFGPKRMIEMVTTLVDTLRQTRDAMRQMNWSLTGDDSEPPASVKPPVSGEDVSDANAVESAPAPEDT